MENFDLYFGSDGIVRAIYDDDLADLLSELGEPHTQRASHVEPDGSGWSADLSPVGGPILGPFTTRREALSAEVEWLDINYLERSTT